MAFAPEVLDEVVGGDNLVRTHEEPCAQGPSPPALDLDPGASHSDVQWTEDPELPHAVRRRHHHPGIYRPPTESALQWLSVG